MTTVFDPFLILLKVASRVSPAPNLCSEGTASQSGGHCVVSFVHLDFVVYDKCRSLMSLQTSGRREQQQVLFKVILKTIDPPKTSKSTQPLEPR